MVGTAPLLCQDGGGAGQGAEAPTFTQSDEALSPPTPAEASWGTSTSTPQLFLLERY